MSSPLFARFSLVFLGYIPTTLSNSDLPDLKQYAAEVLVANLATFLHGLRTVYETECTPANVALIALGENPVLVRAVEVTFTEREKRDLRLNVLPKP